MLGTPVAFSLSFVLSFPPQVVRSLQRKPFKSRKFRARMDRWRGRVALVTGASSGIGASVASLLVKNGLVVVGCARNSQRVQDLATELKDEPGRLVPIACDLQKEEDILSMFEKIRSDFGVLHVCVNNAGLGRQASILEGSVADWRQMIDVNVLAVCLCTKEAVKLMRSKDVDDGHIININSMSGHRLVPGKTAEHVYGATKFSVTAITEGTRRELRAIKSRIRVTQISPGMVHTEFHERMFEDKEKASSTIAGLDTVLTARDIADCVLFAIQSPSHMMVHDVLLRPTTQVF